MTILGLRKVSRHFGGIQAVKNVDAEIRRGRITAIIGPNGAGKTTLFNTISGIYPPSSGSIVFDDGTEITGKRADAVAAIGISRTFQNIRLFPSLTVLDNVKIGFHARTRMGVFGAILPFMSRREEREIELAGLHCLDFVGLAAEAGNAAGSLPYGKQRLVEIARALAASPSLLLLDEPAAGMNNSESDALVGLIDRIRNAGVSVVMIEHHMAVVMQISDYVYVLDHGELISQGTPGQVCADPKVVEAYLGCEGGPGG